MHYGIALWHCSLQNDTVKEAFKKYQEQMFGSEVARTPSLKRRQAEDPNEDDDDELVQSSQTKKRVGGINF